MADLLPSSSDVSDPEADEPRVVGVDSDAADDLLAALSSRTARRVLTELHEEPSTPARLAERVDTSLQNAQYHLGKLEDAGLIEVVDTVYSEKGREMKVFAPADRALVVVAGREEETTGLKATLKRLLGSVGVLGVASLLVDRLLSPGGVEFFGVGEGGESGARGGSGGQAAGSGDADPSAGAESARPAAESTPAGTTAAGEGVADGANAGNATGGDAATTATEAAETTSLAEATTAAGRTVTETAAREPTTVVDAVAGSPGLLFFLGGLTALALVAVALRT